MLSDRLSLQAHLALAELAGRRSPADASALHSWALMAWMAFRLPMLRS